MNRIYKKLGCGLFVLVLSLGVNVFAVTIEKTQALTGYFELPVVAELSVKLRDIDTDQQVPLTGLSFSGFMGEGFSQDNPWVIADQYIEVLYNCNLPNWGIRIVTDNKPSIPGMAPKPIGIGPGEDGVPGTADDTWGAGEDGVFGTEDDIWGAGADGIFGTEDDTVKVTYGGLVHSGKYKDDPNIRAVLVWQLFKDKPDNGPTQLIDNTVDPTPDDDTDNWKTDWAYVVDKSDSGFSDGIILDFIEQNGKLLAVYNYNLVAFGNGVNSSLANHPVIDPEGYQKPGDGDIVVFLGARFYTKYPTENGIQEVLLPAGNYTAKLYIELVSE